LAVKDGRALHVGDEIEFRFDPHDKWRKAKPERWQLDMWTAKPPLDFEWRWPKE